MRQLANNVKELQKLQNTLHQSEEIAKKITGHEKQIEGLTNKIGALTNEIQELKNDPLYKTEVNFCNYL